ncbi:hypothetical protein Tco_0821266 [Tanacetum coccineum]|uniref:Uncharacterized protein n=1 Tax=Tanacetum coccineum TaxID=301880 RepID=A0ABQ5AES1_9ASTR
MEFESTNSNTTTKLPILKLENGDSWVSVPQTAQENGQKLATHALPNEHQLTFSQYPNAKTMFAAIKTRFGGNAATKKTQKTLLKQHLPPEWNTHVVVWMNKPEVETMGIDDLYNNFKFVEQKVKKSVSASTGAQNLAFMTAPSTSALMIQHASPKILKQIHEDNLEAMDLKWQLSLLKCFIRVIRCGHFTRGAVEHQEGTGKEQVQDKHGSMAFQTRVEETTFSLRERWRLLFSVEVAVLKREVAEPEFKGYGPENSKQESNIVCDKKSDDSKENSDNSLVTEQVSKDTSSFIESSLNVDKETIFPVDKKVESVNPSTSEKYSYY